MNDPKLNIEDIDNLSQAILTLTQELWVVKDRQRVLEAALQRAGVIDPTDIDQYQPDPALTGLLETERQQLIENILSSLHRPSE